MARTSKTSSHQPFVRQSKKRRAAGPGPSALFEPLEPRKLLTTLYAFADPALGQTNSFVGWVAMPTLFDTTDADSQLDTSYVESRSYLVQIQIIDSGDPVGTGASVTIRDLDGHTLFPWIGQIEDDNVETDVDVSISAGEDGLWGSDDDVTFSGFGLDVGYLPGWRVAIDPETGNFIPGVWVPDNMFDPVRTLEWDEDLGQWVTEDPPEDRDIVIPATGIWSPGMDGIYRTADDNRAPGVFPDFDGTDDRLFGTGDDPDFGRPPDSAFDPYLTPIGLQFDPHLLDRGANTTDPTARDGFLVPFGMLEYILGAGDGIADFNNGIGSITFNNTSGTTRLVISVYDDPQAFLDGEPILQPFEMPAAEFQGVFGEFDLSGDWFVDQRPGMGHVIIGNPTNVDWTLDEPWFMQRDERIDIGMNLAFPVAVDINRSTEGIFFEDPSLNETMGRIFIDGALFGGSRFPGALDMLHVGYLGGDVFVDGDLDALIVAGDAGFYIDSDEEFNVHDTVVHVGRTFGSFVVGGTMSATIEVEGDFSPEAFDDKPFLRSGASVIEYETRKPRAEDMEAVNQGPLFSWLSGDIPLWLEEPDDEAITYLSNDTIGTAQFINRARDRIRLTGSIGLGMEFGPHGDTDERDRLDWFAFAVDGLSELVIQPEPVLVGGALIEFASMITIRDVTGRVVVSRDLAGGEAGFDDPSAAIRWTPTEAGIYYLVLGNEEANPADTQPYSMNIRGLAPVTLGEITTRGRIFYTPAQGTTVFTQVGSIGSIRVGLDSDSPDDQQGALLFMSLGAADSLWNLTTGSSVGAAVNSGDEPFSGGLVNINVQNDVGQILAGFGRSPDDDAAEFIGGSITSLVVDAGGDIGRIWAQSNADDDYGDIGMLATADRATQLIGGVSIDAGGSIGVIHAATRLFGAVTTITVGDGGVIDLIEAGADVVNLEGDAFNLDLTRETELFGIIDAEAFFSTGFGGNIRFVRAPHVFSTGEEAARLELFAGEKLTLVDDSGSLVTIELSGGQSGGVAPSSATIITTPIGGSLGVAITRIVADLAIGADLIITNDSGRVEIGDLIVLGSAFDSGQQIVFNGSGRTDVYYLRAFGAFDRIENNTTGDMIAIDVGRVEDVFIRGNLGTTTTTRLGPKLLGPRLSIEWEEPTQPTLQLDPETRASLLAGVPVDGEFGVGGRIQIDPAANLGIAEDPQGFGIIADPYLNGLMVRETGQVFNVENVRVDGALGDLFVNNTIEKIEVNADDHTPFGEFHGVTGTVYARGNIEFIDVGDGTVDWEFGPFANAGIFAVGQIERLVIDGEGRELRGIISAAGVPVFPPLLQDVGFGIGRIEAKNGASIVRATITTDAWDDFWLWRNIDPGFSFVPQAAIDRIQIKGGGDMRDSLIRATVVSQVDINGGVWDSNWIEATNFVGRVRADEFTATTPTFRAPLYYLDPSGITVAGNIGRVEAKGNILNLFIEAQGNLERVSAQDIEQLIVEVDNEIERIDAKGTFRRSMITAGQVTRIQARNDIDRVTMNVAGPADRIQSKSGSIYRIDLDIKGPDGFLGRLEAADLISGEIRVEGSIDRIRSKSGDIDAFIQTSSNRGHIGEIRAGDELLIELDAAGSVDKLRAGSRIGDGGVIRIRGDVRDVDVKSGVFDAVLLIDGSLTGKFRTDTLVAGSNVEVQGPINTFDVRNGDVDSNVISYSGGINKLDIRSGGLVAGNLIAAYDGSLGKVKISGGDVDGTLHADDEISKLQIKSAGGVGGNVTGVIESESLLDKIDIDGNLAGGRVMALNEISKLGIDGNVSGGAIISAGRLIDSAKIGGSVANSFILAGLEALGDDDELGGTLADTDRFSSGDVARLDVGGDFTNSFLVAGVSAGADGSYAAASVDPDTDLPAGLSALDRIDIDGSASGGSRILADTAINNLRINGNDVAPGGGGADFDVELVNPDLPDLTGYQQFVRGADLVIPAEGDGDQITFSLSGNGTGYVLTGLAGNVQDILFVGTDTSSNASVTVTSVAGDGRVNLVTGATIRTFDDASLGTLDLGDVPIQDAASIDIDGDVNSLVLSRVNTTGTILVGGVANNVRITNNAASGPVSGTFDVTEVGSVNINGGFDGIWRSEIIGSFNVQGDVTNSSIWGRDSIGSVNINGAFGTQFNDSGIATDGSLGSFTARSMREGVISAGDRIDNVSINGNVTDSEILAGMTLGSDAAYNGAGEAADELTTGSIGNVNIRGNMLRSSIAAGVSRGIQGFFGDNDDIGARGLSFIENVNVTGTAQGSGFNSESYAIVATDAVNNVRVDGDPDFQENGNFEVMTFSVAVRPVLVSNVSQQIIANNFVIDVTFSEEVDEFSLTGGDPFDPFGGPAITFETEDPSGVDPTELDYTVTYDQSSRTARVTFTRGFTQANPFVYRMIVDGSTVRSTGGVLLDGNADGVPGDDFEAYVMLGDAGDRALEDPTATWTFGNGETATLYHATNLDLLLTDVASGDKRNNEIVIEGAIGDHADHDPLFFPSKFDVDVYEVNLEAGDIFRAQFNRPEGGTGLFGSVILWQFDGVSEFVPIVGEGVLASGFSVATTDTYYVVVTGGFDGLQSLPTPPTPTIGGPYLPFPFFDLNFEQGVILLGTDAMPVFIEPADITNDVGEYTMSFEIFEDDSTGFDTGIPIEVSGDGTPRSFHDQIGDETFGFPSSQAVDVDIYNITLDDGTTVIEEGTTVTITVAVEKFGSDLGALAEVGLFRVTDPTDPHGGELVGAPGYLGQYSSARDLTFTVELPVDAEYAIYIQGSTESDYQLTVSVDTGTAGNIALPAKQNVLLELNGGFVDWLGRFGSDINGINLGNLGFEGFNQQVISSVVDIVEQKFEDVGVFVDLDLNSRSFGREEFSTVFLAGDFQSDFEMAEQVSIAEKFDVLNQDKSDSAVVFVEDHDVFAPGDLDSFIEALSNSVAREIGHLLGLRTVDAGNGLAMEPDPSIFSPEFPLSGAPKEFGTAPVALFPTLGIIDVRHGAWLFGDQNDQDILQYVLASA